MVVPGRDGGAVTDVWLVWLSWRGPAIEVRSMRVGRDELHDAVAIAAEQHGASIAYVFTAEPDQQAIAAALHAGRSILERFGDSIEAVWGNGRCA